MDSYGSRLLYLQRPSPATQCTRRDGREKEAALLSFLLLCVTLCQIATIMRATTRAAGRLGHRLQSTRRVLLLDGLDPVCKERLRERGIETVTSEALPSEGLDAFDGVIVRDATQITESVLSGAGERLKIVGRAGVAVSNVDLDAATKNGVIVMNTPGGDTNATAEMAMALIMSLSRQVPAAHRAMVEGDRTGAAAMEGSELEGKTIGIIGLGRIGQKVAKWCDAFGMRVIGYDPVASGLWRQGLNVEAVGLDAIWTQSDIISLHFPLSPESMHLVDDAAFARMKRGVRIINSAFGGAVKESALVDALASGKVSGAALDVFESGDPLSGKVGSAAHTLLHHPAVVCTPHLGAVTAEAQTKVAEQIATQMADAFESGTYAGVVNSDIDPSVTSTESGVAPYIKLASRIGAMQSQIFAQSDAEHSATGGTGAGTRGEDGGAAKSALGSIELELTGSAVEAHATVLQRAVLLGFLRERVAEPNRVNLLSVPSLAEEMGLSVSVKLIPSTPADRFLNTVTVCVADRAGGEQRISGTAFGRTVKVVEIDGYELDFEPDGHFTIFNHTNVPGVVAKFSKILGDRGVNISGLHVGSTDTDTSIAMLRTDAPMPPSVAQRIAELGDIEGVRLVSLGDAPTLSPSPQSGADAAGAVGDASASLVFDSETEPTLRPANPAFSSGPCAKRPGYGLPALRHAALGRSHRSVIGKSKLEECIVRTKDLLGVPEDYRVGILPASDTGAFEACMWSMLGPRPVDCFYWESFGAGWFGDAVEQLRLPGGVNRFQAEYGELPPLERYNGANDAMFTYNGTTSGVRVPAGDADWIPSDREGVTLCDATSAVFAMEMPWEKLDATTFSWQKVLGGEGGHGVVVLSPHAVERLESFIPGRPMPKIFRMTKGDGKLNEGIFKGATINTPSMVRLSLSLSLSLLVSLVSMSVSIARCFPPSSPLSLTYLVILYPLFSPPLAALRGGLP